VTVGRIVETLRVLEHRHARRGLGLATTAVNQLARDRGQRTSRTARYPRGRHNPFMLRCQLHGQLRPTPDWCTHGLCVAGGPTGSQAKSCSRARTEFQEVAANDASLDAAQATPRDGTSLSYRPP